MAKAGAKHSIGGGGGGGQTNGKSGQMGRSGGMAGGHEHARVGGFVRALHEPLVVLAVRATVGEVCASHSRCLSNTTLPVGASRCAVSQRSWEGVDMAPPPAPAARLPGHSATQCAIAELVQIGAGNGHVGGERDLAMPNRAICVKSGQSLPHSPTRPGCTRVTPAVLRAPVHVLSPNCRP